MNISPLVMSAPPPLPPLVLLLLVGLAPRPQLSKFCCQLIPSFRNQSCPSMAYIEFGVTWRVIVRELCVACPLVGIWIGVYDWWYRGIAGADIPGIDHGLL